MKCVSYRFMKKGTKKIHNILTSVIESFLTIVIARASEFPLDANY